MHTGTDITFYLFIISVGLHKKCIIFIFLCFFLFLLSLDILFATYFPPTPQSLQKWTGFTVLHIAGTVAVYVLLCCMLKFVFSTSINLYRLCDGLQLWWSRVACWPLVPKFAGSNPAKAIRFLRAKKSSALLPSEGK